jgi:hypothetical protein
VQITEQIAGQIAEQVASAEQNGLTLWRRWVAPSFSAPARRVL